MPNQILSIPTLTCEHCHGPFQSTAYQARYCTLKCKQAAAVIRRRLRETGVPNAAKRAEQSHLPSTTPQLDMDEVARLTALRRAEMLGVAAPLEAETKPESDAIIGRMFDIPRPEPLKLKEEKDETLPPSNGKEDSND